MKKLVLGFIALLVLAWTGLIGWDRWINAHRIMEGPENESELYQNYNPEPVIKRFRYEGEMYGASHGQGAVHLIKSIHHNQDFTPNFTMRADQKAELMNELRGDIIGWLRITNTTVVASHDEADGGFKFDYVAGNSVGSISVEPPVHASVSRNHVLPEGMGDVTVKISLDETWTRPASETQWWMAAVD